MHKCKEYFTLENKIKKELECIENNFKNYQKKIKINYHKKNKNILVIILLLDIWIHLFKLFFMVENIFKL